MAGISSFFKTERDEPFAAERAEFERDECTGTKHKKSAAPHQQDDLRALLPDGFINPNVSRHDKEYAEVEEMEEDEIGWLEPFSCLRGEGNQFCTIATAAGGAFVCYCLVYMMRSPWRAATYSRDHELIGVEFKDALQISWTVAYFIGKSISAPILGGLGRKGRLPLLLFCAGLCVAAWGGFAAIPREGKKWEDWTRVGMIMLTAPPLAFFWCTLFRYLEGRDGTDLTAACLAGALIFGSGLAKTVGSALQDNGVSEETVPVVAGGGALVLLVFGLMWMEKLPPPTIEERQRQGDRVKMSFSAQKLFIAEYWMGFIPVGISAIALTALRDFRDVFAADMWQELNDGDNMPSWLFTLTEVIVGAVVLLALAAVGCVKNNQTAFKLIIGYCIFGALLLFTLQFLADDWLFKTQTGQAVWLTASGVGIFLGYIPISAVLYNRLIAALGVRATSVFVISITDVLGYAGSVGLLLFRNYDDRVKNMTKHEFFRDSARIGAGVVVVSLGVACLYFSRVFSRYHRDPSLRPEF